MSKSICFGVKLGSDVGLRLTVAVLGSAFLELHHCLADWLYVMKSTGLTKRSI